MSNNHKLTARPPNVSDTSTRTFNAPQRHGKSKVSSRERGRDSKRHCERTTNLRKTHNMAQFQGLLLYRWCSYSRKRKTPSHATAAWRVAQPHEQKTYVGQMRSPRCAAKGILGMNQITTNGEKTSRFISAWCVAAAQNVAAGHWK